MTTGIEQATRKRVVGALSAIYFVAGPDRDLDGRPVTRVRTAVRGDEIELTAEEEVRLEEAEALLPVGRTKEDALAEAEARLDAYRSERGDPEATARHQARLVSAAEAGEGGIVRVDAPIDGSVRELAEWLKAHNPSVASTVALAEDDVELAGKVLDAETEARAGQPRRSVREPLEKIIAGAGTEAA